MQFFTNNRRNLSLVYNGYIFTKGRTNQRAQSDGLVEIIAKREQHFVQFHVKLLMERFNDNPHCSV